MSARLTTAIKIADAAKAIFLKTKSFPEPELSGNDGPRELGHMGVEPMLLALSMELALKAWFVFDYDDPDFRKCHNLIELFDDLKPESKDKLDAEFKRTVAPIHPDFMFVDYGIRDILYQHQDAFTDWRYLHEAQKSMRFNQSGFEATLEMVLKEFRKRYSVERIKPQWRIL